jgi:hypothetical protein
MRWKRLFGRGSGGLKPSLFRTLCAALKAAALPRSDSSPQKNGADGLCMKSVSPKIASPRFGPSYRKLLW